MVENTRLVLYGNSVFLAGIKTQLESYAAHTDQAPHDLYAPHEAFTTLELITMDDGCPELIDWICNYDPCAVLFDLSEEHPGFAVTLLRKRPGLLLIGVDASCDQLLVLSNHPLQAHSIADLVQVIQIESTMHRGGA